MRSSEAKGDGFQVERISRRRIDPKGERREKKLLNGESQSGKKTEKRLGPVAGKERRKKGRENGVLGGNNETNWP